jgi:hypothetical protein
METPDILNSRIKKIRIELPHYGFSHSSSPSDESTNTFVGRKDVFGRLKELVRDTDDKVGVYMVTGNRGVGKSSLVNKVIRHTSLQSGVRDVLKYLVVLFCAVAGVQFCLQYVKDINWIRPVFCVIFATSLVSLFRISEYRRRKCRFCNAIVAVFKDLSSLRNQFSQHKATRYLLKIMSIVCLTQIASMCDKCTPMKAFAIFIGVLIIKHLCTKKIFDIPQRIRDYIDGHNRVYLRINFGHQLKDDKDILRLIARTLQMEYNRYIRSVWHRPHWRIVALVVLWVLATGVGNIVGELSLYENTKVWIKTNAGLPSKKIEKNYVGEATWPIFSVKFHVKTDADVTLKDVFSVKNAAGLLLAGDTLISKIKCAVKHIPGWLWNDHELCYLKKCNSENHPYNSVDYPFWFSFLVLYLFFALLFRSRWLEHFFVTHRMVMRRLNKLNDDITHGTERESAINVPSQSFIWTKTKRSRSVADAREIEKRLQYIFEDIKRIPIIMGRPNFVIVFDELDKVEPGEAGAAGDGPETKAALFSIGATRERQSEILKIMSNMKDFLSNSDAKYIFIAGREMYDIYLADVSDRNNYTGSIFSAVIEVPSFLTDYAEKANKADMTSLTEEFVCRRLIPVGYSVARNIYDLKAYRKYLEKKIYTLKDDEAKRKIHKIIAILQHFIIYLAHVSKGAPKKMLQLFETFIKVHDIDADKKIKGVGKSLNVQYYRRSKFFLTFDFYEQYTMSLLAYLITPIFYRLVEGNISAHNDKLLISSLRFVDFVFKFHNYSFMWKHLDISPEMLEVNRAPELRPITVDLFDYMVQKHMTKSSFSLFDYKFNNLIAGEIFAATKINEVLSALFSFSLDETLPLKKYYKDLLAKTQKEYQNDKRFSSTDFIDAISSLQIVLGDLHYFDDELEEAGIYYRDAIEALRKLGSKDDDDKNKEYGFPENGDNRTRRDGNETMKLEQLYLFVRNMLKVGMIYETRKQHEQAYLIYGEVCTRVIRQRDIAIRELGVGLAIRKTWFDKKVFVKTSTIGNIGRTKEMYNDSVEYPSAICQRGIVNHKIAHPQPLYFQRISPNTNDMLFRKMTYEGLKLLYLPFIVKLQILEKSHMGGIARTHLEHLDKEFDLLTFIIDHKEANILEADFYSRVADVLYYKNSDLKELFGKNRLDDDAGNVRISDETAPSHQNHTCTACHYYHKALSKLLNRDENAIKKNTVIQLLSDCIEKLNDTYYNMKTCTALARILSDWGNVFLSCDISKGEYDGQKNECYICDGQDYNSRLGKSSNDIIGICVEYIVSEKRMCKLLFSKRNDLKTKRDIVFAMYAISFQAFRKVDNYNRAAYQIYKVLRLFKRYEIKDKDGNINELSHKAIGLLWHVADESNAFERKKRELEFGKDNNDNNNEVPLRYLLVDNEIAILTVLVKELELESDKSVETLKSLYNLHIASPYGTVYSISARIFQLRLKAEINYEAYKSLVPLANMNKEELDDEINFIIEKKVNSENINKIFGEHNIGDNIFAMLIAESIYCLKEVVRQSKTLGETYLFNHSFMGKIHARLYFWVIRYEKYSKKYKEKCDDTRQLNKLFKSYLDYGWKEQLSAHYELQQALFCYQKCVEVHTEGKAYHTLIDSLYYVKDDYNDRSDHFSIAIERHKIINGEIEKSVNAIKEKDIYKDSKLYDVDNYYDS